MYKAYVTELKNVRPHSNADRLQLADCFGNTVCIDLSFKEGDVGVYFPEGGQLSEEFCKENDLVRRKDENGNPTGGYLDPNKRNITAIRLRGEKSEGLFLPLSCLDYTGVNSSELPLGTVITIINGYEICTKYIPQSNSFNRQKQKLGNRVRKKKVPIAPLFIEHADTEQLAYNLAAFHTGDLIDITLKMHGTSARTAYLPTFQGYADSRFTELMNWARRRVGKEEKHGKPIYEYDYVTGTRRVVLDPQTDEGGYYGNNDFRYEHTDTFRGKLLKGEEIYYEIIGFTNEGTPIMGQGKTPKEGEKLYGKTMCFSYNCDPDGESAPKSDIYVYRMTMTNEDGDLIEYSPDFMRYRCEQMGVKCVPRFETAIIPEDVNPGEWVLEQAEKFYDGPDPVGKTHVREGVVIRIVNRPKFSAYKHKNFLFKVATGIIAENTNIENLSEDILSEL